MIILMHKKLITEINHSISSLKVFKVGGCIRDRLLNLPVTDIDYVVVGSSPEEMLRLGFKPVGKDFPVFLHPQSHEEYALARSEKKTHKGHQGFIFSTSPDITLAQDLKRRDITINAIAEDRDGRIIDPFNGIQDLNNKIIRHVSPAFIEDPLRVLRVARFSAKLNFNVADETLALMHKITLNGELNSLSQERIWLEINKALVTRYSIKFFIILNNVDALKIILPEFVALINNEQMLKTLYHITERMDRAGYKLEQRFAVLYYFVSTLYTTQKTLELIDRSIINNKSKTLAHLLVNYYNSLHIFDSLSKDDIYKLVSYLDPIRRQERYQMFCELVYMIADVTNDTKTKNHLEILKKMTHCLSQIDHKKLKNTYANDFILQLNILKYSIIEQILSELPDNC